LQAKRNKNLNKLRAGQETFTFDEVGFLSAGIGVVEKNFLHNVANLSDNRQHGKSCLLKTFCDYLAIDPTKFLGDLLVKPFFLSVCFFFRNFSSAQILELPLQASQFPQGWVLKNTVSVTPEQLTVFSQRLGGTLVGLSNIFIEIQKIPIKINTLQCSSPAEAHKVYENLCKFRQSTDFCQLRGVWVLEYICQSRPLVQKVKTHFAPPPSEVRWVVQFQVSPLAEVKDYMQWNPFFNALLQNAKTEKPDFSAFLPYFTFQNMVSLPLRKDPRSQATYHFEPVALKISDSEADQTLYTFASLPHIAGLPFLKIQAEIPVFPFQGLANTEKPEAFFTQKTPFWPVEEKKVQELVKKILKPDLKDDTARALALLQWVSQNIKYAGENVGSRYGVLQVLQQGYGRCWDKSDVFITLCRAAHLPTRQVGGWLYPESGHIWAEVYLEGKGWYGADPTCFWLGTSEDYIPLFLSSDGTIPFIYHTIPQCSKKN
jgi:hypothetical protein